MNDRDRQVGAGLDARRHQPDSRTSTKRECAKELLLQARPSSCTFCFGAIDTGEHEIGLRRSIDLNREHLPRAQYRSCTGVVHLLTLDRHGELMILELIFPFSAFIRKCSVHLDTLLQSIAFVAVAVIRLSRIVHKRLLEYLQKRLELRLLESLVTKVILVQIINNITRLRRRRELLCTRSAGNRIVLAVSAVVRPQPTVEQSFAVITIAVSLATSFCTPKTSTHLNESSPFADPSSDSSKVGAADTAHTEAYALVAELDRRSG